MIIVYILGLTGVSVIALSYYGYRTAKQDMEKWNNEQ